jgi:hypothetical protein
MQRERLLDLLVEGRHDLVQHLDQVEEHVLALIGDGQPLARMVLGLPRRREFGADLPDQVPVLVRCERGVETVEQQVRQPQLLAQDGAPGRFGGVRHEHRLDAQRADECKHLLARMPRGLEPTDGVSDASGLGTARIVQEISTPATYPMQLFSEVDRLEPRRERPFEVARYTGRPVTHARLELLARRVIPPTPRDRQGAVALDEFQQRLTALVAQHLPHQCAEQVYVVAQRGVLGRELDLGTVHGKKSTKEDAGCWAGVFRGRRRTRSGQNL